MKIFVIIPSFNEAERIGRVLEELSILPYQVVVVDDGSSDQTAEVLKNYSVDYLRHKINRGQGAALRTGTDYALEQGADIIVHFDADGQFLTTEIEKIIYPLKNQEIEIVFGSRFLGIKSEINFLKKFFILPFAHLVNFLFFGIRTTDPQNGFRAFKSSVAKKIQIEQDGGAHCSEILAKAFQNKLKWKEVPVTVLYNRFGQSVFASRGRGQSGLQILRDLLFSKIIK
ncbi:glycosyltransferase family 2 protein [Candidatus Nomurabacteria bacterium]|nr:glycosyltransferase family 2 protein [Candidatus Nomurabacteria bacterium]